MYYATRLRVRIIWGSACIQQTAREATSVRGLHAIILWPSLVRIDVLGIWIWLENTTYRRQGSRPIVPLAPSWSWSWPPDPAPRSARRADYIPCRLLADGVN